MTRSIREKARGNVYSVYSDNLLMSSDLISPHFYNDGNFPQHDRAIDKI